MKQGRKFWLAIIYEAVLTVVFAGVVLLTDKFDATMFGMYLAAFGAGFVTYVMGNVAGKPPGPPVA